MKKTVFGLALLIGGAAFAQIDVTADTNAYEGDGAATAAFETEGAASGTYSAAAATADAAAALVRPSNSNPERDARGIAVISAPALAPAGWNGTPAGEAMGGPELDSITGDPVAAESYPACTAAVTDKCVQDYEVGR